MKCNRRSEAERQTVQLESALKTIEPSDRASIQRLAAVCQAIGEEASKRIQAEIDVTSDDYTKRVALLEGLAECGVDDNLVFLLTSLEHGGSDVAIIERLFARRMTPHTRERLVALLNHPGNVPIPYILRALSLVVDDNATLEVALSLTEKDLPVAQQLEVVGLLASASYHLDRPDLVKQIKPYLESDATSVRFAALLSLTMVPGQEAATLLESETTRQAVNPSVVDELRESRRDFLSRAKRRPVGWR